ncbi:unnamed protein product [Cyclocybe aegerita]|uniref:Uncharacterized protein n=1 Tax=Cyclocybe aegerita TaxID=1973307 RepID=A0A8S0XUQ8_CYCAE|nr:unnamed protein product [Cyclocybe aegerita]
MYLSAAEKLCQGSLPTRRVRSKIYTDLELEWDAQDVMGCLTEAGATPVKMGKYLRRGSSDWFNQHVGTKQHCKQVYTTYDAIAEGYLKLGNTRATSVPTNEKTGSGSGNNAYCIVA